MPKKPTTPFGYISFSKAGKASRHILTLSNDKTIQEREVAESFVDAYNKFNRPGITNLLPLPENDQDFLVTLQCREILLQVTELTDRSFTNTMTQKEYDSCQWQEAIQKEYGQRPWKVDIDKRNAALSNIIQKKLDKHYAGETRRDLWLLIFTTNTLYEVEYFTGGECVVSNAMAQARSLLQQRESVYFKKIWFTNMITAPIRIWPVT